MLEEQEESLVWDYTADEDSQLLASGCRPKKRKTTQHTQHTLAPGDDVLLSRQHISRLLHQLQHAVAELERTIQQRDMTSPDMTASPEVVEPPSCLRDLIKKFDAHVLFVTLVLHAAMIAIASVIEITSNTPYAAAAVSIMVMVLLAVNLVLFAHATYGICSTFLRTHTASTCSTVQILLSAVFIFATLYSLSFRWKMAGWESVLTTSEPLYAEVYTMMMYTALAHALPIGSALAASPCVWFNFLLLFLQMLFCFLLFILLIHSIIHPPITSVGTSHDHSSANQSARHNSFRLSETLTQSGKLESGNVAILKKQVKPSDRISTEIYFADTSVTFETESTDTAYTSDTAFIEKIAGDAMSSVHKVPSYCRTHEHSLLQSLEDSTSEGYHTCCPMNRDMETAFLRTAYGSI